MTQSKEPRPDYFEGVSNGIRNIWCEDGGRWWIVHVRLPNGNSGEELYQGKNRKRAFEIYEQGQRAGRDE